MNAHTDDYGRITDESPEAGELWMVHIPAEAPAYRVFAAVECTGVTDDDPEWVNDEEIGTLYSVDPLWTTGAEAGTAWLDFHSEEIDESHFAFRLPDEEFDAEYASALDYITGHLTPDEVLEVLNGEDLHVGHETGFEALRGWILEGIREGITEFSVGHGHGASRYGRAVESRLDELPDWAVDDVLYSEKERWSPWMDQGDSAGHVVEVLLLREEHLDEDNHDEIVELVHEFDLEYDEYQECQHCGALGEYDDDIETRVEQSDDGTHYVVCNECEPPEEVDDE